MRRRLTESQVRALELLEPNQWRGVREGGPPGNTLHALEERGLVVTRVAVEPYRHMVGRLTPAGVDERNLRRLSASAKRARLAEHGSWDPEHDRLLIEGVIRNAREGGVDRSLVNGALEALDRLLARAAR